MKLTYKQLLVVNAMKLSGKDELTSAEVVEELGGKMTAKSIYTTLGHLCKIGVLLQVSEDNRNKIWRLNEKQ